MGSDLSLIKEDLAKLSSLVLEVEESLPSVKKDLEVCLNTFAHPLAHMVQGCVEAAQGAQAMG